MKKYVIASEKGGVGKTTTAINLAAAFTRTGKRVLVIDMDPQCNLTEGFGINPATVKRSITDVLKGKASVGEAVITKEGIDLLPSSPLLINLEMQYVKKEEFGALPRALKDLDGYDCFIIDCPPNLGILTLNALISSIDVVIPIQSQYMALLGLRGMLDTIQFVRDNHNPHIDICGILPTMYDKRKRLNREAVDAAREEYGDKVFETVIRDNVALAVAPSWGQSIFEYQPDSYGAKDYAHLGREILERG